MCASPSGDNMRTVLLQVVDEYYKQGSGMFQTRVVLTAAARRLNIGHDPQRETALLTYWNDLFRTGYLGWGADTVNADPPFCHVTAQGRRALANLSRDPANPDGYLALFTKVATLNPVFQSYLEEGLKTYNADCFKAAAVMIGCAAERIVLDLRDVLIQRLNTLQRTPARDLQDWRIKRVLDALKAELDKQKKQMPIQLAESYDGNWSAFTHQIRASRNESGHPVSIAPISQERVHASLLILPELFNLAADISIWVSSSYM